MDDLRDRLAALPDELFAEHAHRFRNPTDEHGNAALYMDIACQPLVLAMMRNPDSLLCEAALHAIAVELWDPKSYLKWDGRQWILFGNRLSIGLCGCGAGPTKIEALVQAIERALEKRAGEVTSGP